MKMKKLFQKLRITKAKSKNIDSCKQKLDIQDQAESDSFFGGFREYKPPIYTQNHIENTELKIKNLFSDTNA
ncbi:hypothetical protein SAMN05421856_10895 [Chryseobacterium taichungense]|uniref:Uncharacterized protein n=2 Tax=Chryseobacterium taichungense TaxID=295069 RepID=A0A1H8C5R4_9FLAO|nr:hypothetical protein SAMN05421856_10895 [Chryseobacterium taichungense]